MSEINFPEEMFDDFDEIYDLQIDQFRQARTMLAGFKALQERDIDYMDEYMDPLLDCMEQQSESEFLMREYIEYISTFNKKEASLRFEELEQDLGYWTKAVYAAGLTAQKLHKGQKDKGGNDYFTSHLLKVALSGHNWKEQVVGFLHDATEDTPHTLEEVMEMLSDIHHTIDSQPKKEWWQDWMGDVVPYYGPGTYFITGPSQEGLKEALTLLNHHNSATREEYLEKISKNKLAIKVKLNDLDSNMDLTRIAVPTAKDISRVARYKKEQSFLLRALSKILSENNT